MEEKVNYGYVAENCQRQMYLGESRVAMIWNHVGRGGGEGRERNEGQQPRGCAKER